MTAHGALWKWRAAENEGKPKPGFPSLFPGPWKSPGDSPILHSADRGCLCLKTPTKTKERSPRFALARFSLLQAHSSIRKCCGPHGDSRPTRFGLTLCFRMRSSSGLPETGRLIGSKFPKTPSGSDPSQRESRPFSEWRVTRPERVPTLFRWDLWRIGRFASTGLSDRAL
jgi:hypothetical protein